MTDLKQAEQLRKMTDLVTERRIAEENSTVVEFVEIDGVILVKGARS